MIPIMVESKKLRYYVTNHDLIPLHEQPPEGYTKLQAIERAQREAKEAAYLFDMDVIETKKWFHIMDSNNHYCKELDDAI